ncbi:GntP family permease [Bacillus benzoevorans]|uniref:H+/gluconate symporter-like permease n=1 Tax=Bacillus benzoevorans TaxID=1456 RepID=A0A7X0LWM2_9BACI|nr:GntP family permease [Bacillus benzoevorans]MBB6446878.1 H+/gluconate symporter-like permease [Bacillus benzoevorans]
MVSILIGLAVLVALSYIGWSIIWVAPLAAGVVALLSGLDFFDAYTNTYMTGLVGFVQKWFPLFLLGAIFGKLMEATGAAKSIAVKVSQLIGTKRALLGVLLATSILAYGGVSVFVIVFAIYPIAIELFREANISRKLIVPTIMLGLGTYAMASIPGSPQIHNLIPMPYFHTTPTAAPIIGIVTALIMAVGGYLYLAFSQKRLTAKGEGYVEPESNGKPAEQGEEKAVPNWILSFIPLLLVIIFLNVVKLEAIYALLIGIVGSMLLNLKDWKQFIPSINGGGAGSVMAILNTSAAVGFGAVIAAVPAFADITTMLFNLSDNPLFTEAISVQVMSMITGSAAGGMGIALSTFGDTFYQLSQTTGISPEVFHRIASVASTAAILPNCGALLTMLAVTNSTMKDTYKYVFVIGLLIPTIATYVAVLMGAIGIK